MDGKIFSLAAVLFLGLFLVLGFAPLAAADNGGKSVVDRYDDAKGKYLKHVDAYQQAKRDWNTAKGNWRKFKRANETAELIERSKAFLNSGIDRAVSYLEVLNSKVEGLNASAEEKASMASQIDASIAAFNALKPEVDAAQTKADIEAVSKKVNDQYKLLKPLVKRMTGLYLSAKINALLARGDALAAKAQEKIDLMKAGGIDASKAEADLANFNEHLANAKAKYESAKQTFNSISTPADADALFKRGHNYLKEVNQYLRKAYAELKDLNKHFGRIRLSGTGAVSASGNGLAEFEGTGTFKATASQTGALLVSSNAVVSTDGQGSKEDLGNGTVKYQGFGTATATSNGSSFEAKLSGNGISLYANGSGTLKLSGRGTYNTSTGKTGSFPVRVVVSPGTSGTPAATATPQPTSTPAPTANATAVPTANATATPEPTAIPTANATATPTSTPEPTATPAPEPTANATITPTPTPVPTVEPTATPTPSPAPTAEPTATPTPTPEPTLAPTPTPEGNTTG